jgi:hypothetical protein
VGAVGVFDHIDPNGQPVYRLNPGESFDYTFAWVLGSYFHNPEHPQPSNTNIDSSLFDFTGLMRTAHRARILFNGNYTYQPPSPPPNFGPAGSLNAAVYLRWNVPQRGNIAGYNLYGVADAGQGARTQFNTTLLTDTSYTVTGLTNGGEWVFQAEAVDDSEFASSLSDTLVRVGAITPITGLIGHRDDTAIYLDWDASNDPTLVNYRVLRRDRLGDSTTIIVTDNHCTDISAVPGHMYTYWVIAENSRGLYSYPSDSVALVRWNPQRRVLLIDETDLGSGDSFGGVPDSLVDSLYTHLLTDLGESFDVIEHLSGTAPNYTFEQLAQYDVVVWYSEDNKSMPPNPATVITPRERILTEYVQNGGRLLRVVRAFLWSNLAFAPGPVRYFSGDNANYLRPQTFDSLYSAPRYQTNPGMPYMKFIGATAAQPGFSSVMLDTNRLLELDWLGNHYDWLPVIDVYWPHAPTQPLYRTVLREGDSSGLGNQPCAVIGQGIVIIGFPLYFLSEDDARNILRASLDTLRSETMGANPTRNPAIPATAKLYQNYPNPFNPVTEIAFDLPKAMRVEVRVFNTLGQLVTTLVDEHRAAGSYRVSFDGSRLASGLYLYQLKAGDFAETKKMILLK